MEVVRVNPYGGELGGVDCGAHAQAFWGGGGSDEVDDDFIAYLRLTPPVQAEERKQPVFDLVPFAGCNSNCFKIIAHLVAKRIDSDQYRDCNARILMDPGDPHAVLKLHFARAHQALDGCRRSRFRSCGQRYMALTGKESGGRIETDPTRSRKIHLGPRMQIGEVGFGAGGAVE